MNLQKTMLSLLFFITVSATAFAQKGIDSQVNDLIKKDNLELTINDKSLKLSKKQEAKLRELYKELLTLEKEAPKSKKKKETFNKKIEEKRKKTYAAKNDLLTPKQKQALKR
ncbi:hypothetical protein [Flavivirga jejuensis]|uniref:LTXXQ motif family protein n=1 Tax=Flavivirga jejuensis TaxID=870487 RepID=A0ABT8WRH6_9FLAO|nr:hypothetical protein [Flavivirga jejuensis]MDO5975750.1 hypothetical protein [Flavivirga jejuensis]